MDWVVFSYTIPAPAHSSPRVALWRRLRRVGAISPAGSVYVLPARPECIEAFQWLAQEVRAAKGEAIIMRVEQFEGLEDAQMIAYFNQSRAEEYLELGAQVAALEREKDRVQLQQGIEQLLRRHTEILRVDYFACPEGSRVAQRLAALYDKLTPTRTNAPTVPSARIADYRSKTWVTRPRPYIDRLACAWLIRRFVNPQATIRYSLAPKVGEVAFDMEEGGQFGHFGNLCTFEAMLRAFELDDPGLRTLSEIVHEIDLRDGRHVQPAVAGVDSILDGWHRDKLSDAELQDRGCALFEGLYLHFLHGITERGKRGARTTKGKLKGEKR